MTRYRVLVDDNFHDMDDDERTEFGVFETEANALAACRDIVDRSLRHHYRSGMTAAELLEQYRSFGDDPFVLIDGAGAKVTFSAWDYAESRCAAICAERAG
jgi:hypothetical protein